MRSDPKAEIRYEYDAVGNRRRVWSYYHDGVEGANTTRDYWYAYDSMNRFVVSMGQLSGGVRGTSAGDATVSIVKGSSGVQLSYNAASERVSAVYGSDGHREDYTYTADGYLEDTRIDGVLRARRVNDALGRVSAYTEYNSSGTTAFTRTSTYNDINQATQQLEWDGVASGNSKRTLTFDYAVGGPLNSSSQKDGATTVTAVPMLASRDCRRGYIPD
ncbi:hypothetical protein [Pseudomonas schmalbachii]|uniref:RHS repeat protein n=1 Tax=Pseudomonas schmalbachii TaxID=2816993 RepID=A0ABS3TJM3_9PSED|nr:hypothetical protein [Pseudomonas schmalbachii]MBO3273847.1 hypothetical protein [Pseudomonas schmalbachii]